GADALPTPREGPPGAVEPGQEGGGVDAVGRGGGQCSAPTAAGAQYEPCLIPTRSAPRLRSTTAITGSPRGGCVIPARIPRVGRASSPRSSPRPCCSAARTRGWPPRSSSIRDSATCL